MGSRPVARTPHFFLHALHKPVQESGCPPSMSPTSASASQAVASVGISLGALDAISAPAAKTASDSDKLSTGQPFTEEVLVDDLAADISVPGFSDACGRRLGLVLPKKQARRSVTRSLIRHQAREALRRHVPAVLAEARRQGIEGWVLRLRAPFDKQTFPSAASDALKALVRQELDALWQGLNLSACTAARQHRPGKGKDASSAVYKAPPAPDTRGAA